MENVSLPEHCGEVRAGSWEAGPEIFLRATKGSGAFGLRVNPLKAGEHCGAPFRVWSGLPRREGFYYPEELDGTRSMRREPIIQEPSARACAKVPGLPARENGSWTSVRLPGGKEYPSGRKDGGGGAGVRWSPSRPGQRSCPEHRRRGIGNAVGHRYGACGLVPGSREFSRRHRRGRSLLRGRGCSGRMRMREKSNKVGPR